MSVQGAAYADMAAAQSAIAAGNFPAAGAALAPLASSGDAQAQFQWASLSLDGRAVGLAPERAISLLVQSAAQGNSHAQARLGMAYAHGDHVAIDRLAAYHWLSRASTAPDLSDEEREQVTSLRKELLDEIAPTNKYAPPPPGTASTANSSQKVPPAEKATAAPVTSVSSVPLFSNAPLPNPSDDDANNNTAGDASTVPADKSAGDDKTAPNGKATQAGKSVASSQPAAKVAIAPAATSSAKAATPGDAPSAIAATPVSSPPVPATSISTASGTAASSGKAYFVQLASLPTETAATSEAGRLARKYADILQGIDVSVREANLGAKGFTRRVLAGPFDNLSTAKDHCAQLAARKQECRVIAMSN